jgi:Fe2+ or Zn2+ uptake regulation protein
MTQKLYTEDMNRTTTPDALAERLRTGGLRVTAGRVAVLEYLDGHHHCSASDIHRALGAELPSLSPQSVHNIVGDLSHAGLLRRLDLPDSGGALYEPAVGNNHHHVQCVVCGRIEDVACVVGQAPCLRPDHEHGMRILEAAVTFRGICRDCETRDSPELRDTSEPKETPEARDPQFPHESTASTHHEERK